nr:S1 RNA-binding domain-containing protein [uncultured Carboxylicivirga sp.]
MNKLIEELKAFFEGQGLSTMLIIIILLLLFVGATKPENFQIYFGFLWRILAHPFKALRKKSIKSDVEGPCTKALKRIAKELPDIDIPALGIKWVNEDNLDTVLKDGKAIVKLKFEDNPTKNIVKATSIYVKDAFLKHTKPYINDNFRKAIDISVTKKILLKIEKNNSNILATFHDENASESVDVFERCEQIEDIDDSGLFTRVLLRELDLFGKKLHGRTVKDDYKRESDEFLQFVNQISTREYDDDTPLAFSKQILKVGIVLVAKEETFTNYGIKPYLRRIKLGMSKGIESFYLLARGDSVHILKEVATQLLNTGNFVLINNPKEYFDSRNRSALCYCIRINDDSILSNTLKEIGNAIENKTPIAGIITYVKESYLKIDINGIEGYLQKQNLSVIDIQDARKYFKEGTYIEAIPIEIQENGIVEFGLRNTKSDPNNILTSQFEIGKRIVGKISFIEDSFITVDLGLDKVEGFVFRKDLTYSRYEFLHKLFQVGDEHEFDVLGYNFERGNIRLKLADLKDPWERIFYSKNSEVELIVCKKAPRSFVGEIAEGIEAVLPIRELSWLENEVSIKKEQVKLNDKIKCFVDIVDKEKKIVFVTLKQKQENPYIRFSKVNNGKSFDFIISEVNSYGIIGYINDESKFIVYVPSYETTWNGSSYSYRVGNKYQVQIIGTDKYNAKLLGSFKPFIKHPLSDFSSSFKLGQVLKKLQVVDSQQWGLFYTIKHRNKEFKALLHRRDITDGFIEDCSALSKVLNDIPLCLSLVDMEKNRIALSLKDLVAKNHERIEHLNYEDTYEGNIIAFDRRDYRVLIKGVWVVGTLETENQYKLGDTVIIRPVASNGHLIVTDD